MQRFFAPGKLLLSAEYSVLRNVPAIAVPTRYGQSLSVNRESTESLFCWEAQDYRGESWFSATINENFELEKCDDQQKGQLLTNLLHTAFNGNFSRLRGKLATSRLDFPRNWGLGSSSSLTALIAQWAGCNAMDLFFKNLNGSGYDVAVALEKQPLIYQRHSPEKPEWKKVQLPEVLKQSYFVHLQKKQDSQREVTRFDEQSPQPKHLQSVTAQSRQLLEVKSVSELINWMRLHEEITEKIIGRKAISQQLFPDFEGGLKSLGAWGGDFIWAAGPGTPRYFEEKGYPTIIPFAEMCAV